TVVVARRPSVTSWTVSAWTGAVAATSGWSRTSAGQSASGSAAAGSRSTTTSAAVSGAAAIARRPAEEVAANTAVAARNSVPRAIADRTADRRAGWALTCAQA